MLDLAKAIWDGRSELLGHRDRFERLRLLVGSPQDLTLSQWFQLYAASKSFSPDLIIELGRGYGNSTCVFTEAANSMEDTHVVSIGINGGWETRTLPRLHDFVSQDWFKNLKVVRSDIRQVDFKALMDSYRRVLLFWDAHGHDLAAFILAELMPLLASRDHLVCVHDVADARHEEAERRYARNDGLPTYWAGPFVSAFPEILYIHDFICRNGLTALSPAQSAEQWRQSSVTSSDDLAEFNTQFDPESPLTEGGWIYFDAASATEYPDRATLLDRYDPKADLPVADQARRLTLRYVLGTAKRSAISRFRGKQNRD